MTARPRAVIIGMMGAGKTRVGKEVAHMLRLPFADADVEIEREVGMKIPSYFEEYGEPAFREVEADLIADMLEDFDGIFSLGGTRHHHRADPGGALADGGSDQLALPRDLRGIRSRWTLRGRDDHRSSPRGA